MRQTLKKKKSEKIDIISGVGMFSSKSKVSKAKYKAEFRPPVVLYLNSCYHSVVICFAGKLKYSWALSPCNV